MTTGRQHHKEIAEFPPPTPYLPQESVLSMPAFLDPESSYVGGQSSHLLVHSETLSRALPQPSDRGKDRNRTHWARVQSEAEGIRQSGELPRVFPVTS